MTELELTLNSLIKKFNIHKKQTTAEALISKGEITALDKMILMISSLIKGRYLEKARTAKNFKDDENALSKFVLEKEAPKFPDLYNSLVYLRTQKDAKKTEHQQKTALEQLFEMLDNDLEKSLRDIDLLNTITEKKTPKDIEIRLASGKCAFKRPGREKFPCQDSLVPGEQYCEEHLKRFFPERYFEKFEEELDEKDN